jgi:hypothetical protein
MRVAGQLGVVAVLAALLLASAAQANVPGYGVRLGQGESFLATTTPGVVLQTYSVLAGAPVRVEAWHRPKRAVDSRDDVRMWVTSGSPRRRCAKEPGDDRGKLVLNKVDAFEVAPGHLRADGEVTFKAGKTKLCMWTRINRGAYTKPISIDREMLPGLFGASIIHYYEPAWIYEDAQAWSTHRMSADSRHTRQTGSGPNSTCETVTKAEESSRSRGHQSSLQHDVIGYAFQCRSRTLKWTVLDGPLAGTATEKTYERADGPLGGASVIHHAGACAPAGLLYQGRNDAARVLSLLGQVGCTAGRVIYERLNPDRAPDGRVYELTTGGIPMRLAPAGTRVDVVVDGDPPATTPPAGTEPKPVPGTGYPGIPTPVATPGCTSEVKTGPVVALAACFLTKGDRVQSAGRVRLNGIDLTPARSGVTISIDRRTSAITSSGPVELRIGQLSLLRDQLDWRRPDQAFEIGGEPRKPDASGRFTTKRQHIFDLPVKGSAKLSLKGGATELSVSVSIPDSPRLRFLSGLADYSGELTAQATNDEGLVLDAAKVSFPGLKFGFVEIQDASLGVSRGGDGAFHFDGGATVYPLRFTRFGIVGELGIGPGDGYAKLALAGENLNKPLGYGIFMQRIGLGLQINPFGMKGSAAITLGPQWRVGGNLESLIRLDGTLEYLGKKVTQTGALEIVDTKAADGKIVFGGSSATVEASGNLNLTVKDYGFTGSLAGWVDGTRGFNLEGSAKIAVPGPDGTGDAVISTRGAGACRTGLGPDVGFGYTWGRGLGGISFVGSGCSLGQWREKARGAQVGGARTVAVPRGLRQLAVQLVGAGGPPRVAVIAPGGRRIEPSADPEGTVLDAKTFYVMDADTGSTYLVVDDPAPGTWRFETLAGGPVVASLRTAAPLPSLRVRGRVSGRGARRVLRYSLTGLAGRTVEFYDGRRRIGTARRARGRLRFSPAPGSAPRRVIRAVVLNGGIPTGRSRTVARYRAITRPPKPAGVRVSKSGLADRVVRWRGSTELRYEVTARLTDGRRIRRIAPGGQRQVRIGLVPRGVRMRVSVVARDAAGIANAPAAARG